MDGLQLCARYAFAPNYLKYCGPDKNSEIKGYLTAKTADPGLAAYLSQFQTMYPYLKFIAHENGIADPFDLRVIKAYWLGNSLLENLSMKKFWDFLLYQLELKKHLKPKDIYWLFGKIPQGAVVHHSFHVFNIFTRTGHQASAHTIETMDACRIGWGKVEKRQNNSLTINSQKLEYSNKKLGLKKNRRKKVFLPIESWTKEKKWLGKTVSYHWNMICDIISAQEAKSLEKYTKFHLKLANQTI